MISKLPLLVVRLLQPWWRLTVGSVFFRHTTEVLTAVYSPNSDECSVVVHELSTVFVWRRYTKPYRKIKTPWWQWWCPSMIMSELMVWLLSLRQPFVVWSRHCLERYDYLACFFFKFTFRNYCLYNEKTVIWRHWGINQWRRCMLRWHWCINIQWYSSSWSLMLPFVWD